MVQWRVRQKEQFDSLMEDYKLISMKLGILEKEEIKALDEMKRIQKEMQILYTRVCK